MAAPKTKQVMSKAKYAEIAVRRRRKRAKRTAFRKVANPRLRAGSTLWRGHMRVSGSMGNVAIGSLALCKPNKTKRQLLRLKARKQRLADLYGHYAKDSVQALRVAHERAEFLNKQAARTVDAYYAQREAQRLRKAANVLMLSEAVTKLEYVHEVVVVHPMTSTSGETIIVKRKVFTRRTPSVVKHKTKAPRPKCTGMVSEWQPTVRPASACAKIAAKAKAIKPKPACEAFNAWPYLSMRHLVENKIPVRIPSLG